MATAETIPEYLARMTRKHADKGEPPVCGYRFTSEIAKQIGVSSGTALRRLRDLEESDQVECKGYFNGGYLWTVPNGSKQADEPQ